MTTRTALPGGLHRGITLPHEGPLEFYHNALSLCSQKVRLCLAEAGVQYVSRHIHLIETGWYQTCSPDFKKINPGATVPVLVHEGHPVYESHDQIIYINSVLGGDLIPKDLESEVQRWVDQSVMKGDVMAVESMRARMASCIPLLTLPVFASMIQDIPYSSIMWGLLHHPNKERPVLFTVLKFLGPTFAQLPPLMQLIRAARDQMKLHLENLEQHLSDGRQFVCGDRHTLGDVGLHPLFVRLVGADWECLFRDLPHVVAYWERLRARPAHKAAIVDEELPIMTLAFARLRFWKRDKLWLRDNLEGSGPLGCSQLLSVLLAKLSTSAAVLWAGYSLLVRLPLFI